MKHFLEDNYLISWWAYVTQSALGYFIDGFNMNVYVAIDEKLFWRNGGE